jgi:glycosyltransferase involved in cell wall biosynthesis
LRVGVLVDLVWSPQAGGHVKCWERFAEAACRIPDRLDLTVHFSGTATGRHELAPNVRYLIHPPVFSTARIPFLSHVPDHTDLAPYHFGLARQLGHYDLLHTTDAFFAFARTAARVARRCGIPLTNSIHTDTPSYTRMFTAQTIHRLVGQGMLGRLLVERLRLADKAGDDMLAKLARHQAGCRYALVSQPEEFERARQVLPEERLGTLRRGIDRDAFNPAKRNRAWVRETYGVPEDRVLVLFAGRVNRGKNVMVLAQAVRRLVDRGLPVHLLCAGKGDDRQAILDLLGDHASCPGPVPQSELQRLYASADIFAFPSEVEVFANVVQEALTSGLPVVMAEKSGSGHLVDADCGVVLDGRDVDAWERALGELAGSGDHLAAMKRAARARAERTLPSWLEVLEQDLLPRWEAAARE